MISPLPTTRIDAGIARGTLLAIVPASAKSASYVTFAVPNTSYELHLLPVGEVKATPGKRLTGVISAQARRIDVVGTGGQYVEPLIGRPRRVQGTVIRTEGAAVVVDAGIPIHCRPTDPRQTADQFAQGQLVSFDVMDGATIREA